MDGWHLAKFTRGHQAAIDVAYCTADHLLVVMCVVPLLANSRVIEDHSAADKVDQLFVDELGPLLVFTFLVACALGCQLTHSVLERASDVCRADAVHPLHFDFQVVRLAQVVVNRFVF